MTAEVELAELEARLLAAPRVASFLADVDELRRLVALGDPSAVDRAQALVAPETGDDLADAVTEGYEIGKTDALGLVDAPVDMKGARVSKSTLADVAESKKAIAELIEKTKALIRAGADLETAVSPAFAAGNKLRRDVVTLVNRAGNEGSTAVAEAAGMPRVWVAETNACVHCLAYSGRVAEPGKSFPGGLTYGAKSYHSEPLPMPPLHGHCRCVIEPLRDRSYADALRREADRSVLRGFSLESEPMKVRIDAARRLVDRVDAPKSVVAFSRRAIKAGTFPTRGRPAGTTAPPPAAKAPKTPKPKAPKPAGIVPEEKFVSNLHGMLARREINTAQLRAQAEKASPLAKANADAAIARYLREKDAARPPSRARQGLPTLDDASTSALEPRETGGYKAASKNAVLRALNATPAGRLVADQITKFQSGPRGAIARLRGDMEKYVTGGDVPKGRRDTLEAVLGAINGSDAGSRPLYRGMMIPGGFRDVAAMYTPGDDLDLSIASFSSNRKKAEEFSRISEGKKVSAKNVTQVVVEIVGDKKTALPIQNLATGPVYYNEREWLASGRYRVVNTTKGADSYGNPIVHVEIEQVGQW